jgi:acyl-CoA oxidase
MPETTNRNIPKSPVESDFAIFLWGGKEKFERRKAIHEALSTNPIFSKTSVVVPSLARKDAWARAALQARELIRLKLEERWSHTQFMEAIRMTDNMLPVQPQFRIFMSSKYSSKRHARPTPDANHGGQISNGK